MCCFSRKVEHVSATNIFARASKENRQFLVYSMSLSADEDLSMILPLPVPEKSDEDAVRFINLEKYPDFFKDMKAGFPEPQPNSRGPAAGNIAPEKHLKVVEVGSFEASFVPSLRDFERLDERFWLPTEVWEGLPQYAKYGFAVFKLKKGSKTIHPMAFEFPRANTKRLFFPTVHIHDGKVHPRAEFDHSLYCQFNSQKIPSEFQESVQPAELFMKIDQTQGILHGDLHIYLLTLRGMLKNVDTLA